MRTVTTLSCAELYSPANEMENQTGNLGTPLSLSDPASSAQKALLSNTTTYLAKIAIVLHDAPDKMLTFTQVTKIQNTKLFALCNLFFFAIMLIAAVHGLCVLM